MSLRLGFRSLSGIVLGLTLAATSFAAQSTPTPQTAKAPQLTEKELLALLETAKTPADHEKLAAYYDGEAADFDAKASKHKRFAAAYRRMPAPGNPTRNIPDTRASAASHCDNIAAESEKAAKEARSMAEHHRMLAKER